ncbi:MAG: hypothetical protein IJ215_00290 [Clostridia bacterium]|nr:hypothetical protein [Clostridia bacterium]
MKNVTRQMSLLEYDIKTSQKLRLEYYANMPTEQKDEIQQKYISNLIQKIKDKARSDQKSGRCSIGVLPRQIYPYDKMIQDIKAKLRENNIRVTRVSIFRKVVSKCISHCVIYWKASLP